MLHTHCRAGHEYTPENTYVCRRGYQYCRTCRRDHDFYRYHHGEKGLAAARVKQARKQREIDRLVAEHKALSGRIGIIELTLGGRPN